MALQTCVAKTSPYVDRDRATESSSTYWSALATTPASTSVRAVAKEAINFIETFCLVLLPFSFFVSNHKTTTSKQHKKLKFGMQSYFNPTNRNIRSPHTTQEAEIRHAVLFQPKSPQHE